MARLQESNGNWDSIQNSIFRGFYSETEFYIKTINHYSSYVMQRIYMISIS